MGLEWYILCSHITEPLLQWESVNNSFVSQFLVQLLNISDDIHEGSLQFFTMMNFSNWSLTLVQSLYFRFHILFRLNLSSYPPYTKYVWIFVRYSPFLSVSSIFDHLSEEIFPTIRIYYLYPLQQPFSKQYYTWFYFLYSTWFVSGTSILWLDHFFWGHHSYPLHWYWFV